MLVLAEFVAISSLFVFGALVGSSIQGERQSERRRALRRYRNWW